MPDTTAPFTHAALVLFARKKGQQVDQVDTTILLFVDSKEQNVLAAPAPPCWHWPRAGAQLPLVESCREAIRLSAGYLSEWKEAL